MSFTEGPWSASGIRTSGQRLARERLLSILDSQGRPCAFVIYSDRTPADHVQSHADQRLIAAAPEMLGALHRCIIELETFAEGHADAEIEIAKRAVAKAEGRN